METTKEEREWLRVNWSAGEPSFRQWVAGSDRAHEIVPRALRDVDALEEALDTVHSVFRKDASGFPIEYMLAVIEYVGELLGKDEARAVLGE